MVNPDGSVFIHKMVYEFEPRYCSMCQSMTHDTTMCTQSAPRTSNKPPNPTQGVGNPKASHGPKNNQSTQPAARTDTSKGRTQEEVTHHVGVHDHNQSDQTNSTQQPQATNHNPLPESRHGM